MEFSNANNLFCANVYKELIKSSEDNLVVSPLSAEIVLSLTQSGAKGKTADEMRLALHLPSSKEKIQNEIKSLLSTIESNGNYDFYIANKVYVQKNFKIKAPFRKTVVNVYQAEIQNIDFTKKMEAAKTMNKWVEKQTANKIRNLIDPESLTDLTRIILINALYFKAKWEIPFLNYDTTKTTFYKMSQNSIEVDTMHLSLKTFNYYESSELNAKFLELPYEGGDVLFTIVLPNAIEGLPTLENQIEKVLVPHDFKKDYINVALPKFRIENEINFMLGMVKAFSDGVADFSGIADPKGDIYFVISDVIQKTFIAVSEKGTEAAAVTHVRLCGGGYFRPESKDFIVDHPFLYYVKVKNIIVFAGRVTSPQY